MNLKKLVTSAIMALLIMASASAFAQISKSDLDIGGIYYGMPYSDFIAKFGQPIGKQPRAPKGYNYIFRYGNSTFVANFVGKNKYVNTLGVENNCPLSTKSGIHIGSTQADIQAAYGVPDDIQSEGRNLHYRAGRESYELGNGNSCDAILELIFRLDKAGGKVIAFCYCDFLDWENPYPTGSKPQPQQKPSQPQQPIKPSSTIPNKVTEMPAAELNIGWIEPGQSMDNVEKVYGKPGKVDDEGFFQTYNYNDKFIVKGKMNNGYKVMSVASYEKGMKTPSGFMVGDFYSAVVKKFGAVKGIKFKGEGIEAKLKGCTDYTYFSGNKQIVFIVDKNDVIRAIRVEELDEQKFIEAKRKNRA